MTWYVDNNKVSQVEEKLNTKIIENIPKHFGGLTVQREKKYIFGMDIEFWKTESYCFDERLHQ